MGDRYWLTVNCPRCNNVDYDVWYAPTCDVTDHNCTVCSELIDLEELTGITYEDASNLTEIEALIEEFDAWDELSNETLESFEQPF